MPFRACSSCSRPWCAPACRIDRMQESLTSRGLGVPCFCDKRGSHILVRRGSDASPRRRAKSCPAALRLGSGELSRFPRLDRRRPLGHGGDRRVVPPGHRRCTRYIDTHGLVPGAAQPQPVRAQAVRLSRTSGYSGCPAAARVSRSSLRSKPGRNSWNTFR